ncbi:MAG: magnesium transporter [Oscillospiraceae bacterium]|jgi:magnesium transporter|nr:magnesium transporter [Oscillospiraceae bacterium]
MIVFENGGEIKTKNIQTDKNRLYVLHISELSLLDGLPDIKTKIMDGFEPDDCTSKYECYDGHDMLCINIPEELKDMNSFRFFGAYITAEFILCVYEEWEELPYLVEIIRAGIGKGISFKKAVLSLIDVILRDDFTVLGNIEDMIADLEDCVSKGDVELKIWEISSLRRKILPMKRFYEHLIDMVEDLDENENGFFTDTELKYASRILGRIDRLYRTVTNLRDYVTQVREAYQAQMDIGLNRIMKTFTVITAVFLPLTLLAGWYGMNLKMPEFEWRFGYLLPIGLSLSIVTFSLIIFKKKKWF